MLVAGGVVEPIAEVWLADGVQYQRELGAEKTTVIYGSTGSIVDSADVIRELRLSGIKEALEGAVVITFVLGPVELPARPD